MWTRAQIWIERMRRMIGLRDISMTISFCTMRTWVECRVSHRRMEWYAMVCQTCSITIKAKNPTPKPSTTTTVYSSNSQGATWHRQCPSRCTITCTCGRLRGSGSPRSPKFRQSTWTWKSCTVKNRTVSKSNSKKKYRMRNGLCRTRNGHLGWVSRRQPESRIEIII